MRWLRSCKRRVLLGSSCAGCKESKAWVSRGAADRDQGYHIVAETSELAKDSVLNGSGRLVRTRTETWSWRYGSRDLDLPIEPVSYWIGLGLR
jgi:hypothetical protein